MFPPIGSHVLVYRAVLAALGGVLAPDTCWVCRGLGLRVRARARVRAQTQMAPGLPTVPFRAPGMRCCCEVAGILPGEAAGMARAQLNWHASKRSSTVQAGFRARARECTPHIKSKQSKAKQVKARARGLRTHQGKSKQSKAKSEASQGKRARTPHIKSSQVKASARAHSAHPSAPLGPKTASQTCRRWGSKLRVVSERSEQSER